MFLNYARESCDQYIYTQFLTILKLNEYFFIQEIKEKLDKCILMLVMYVSVILFRFLLVH